MKTEYDYYVYMLLCADSTYYVGVTGDLSCRLYNHSTGLDTSCYTYKRRPVHCVYTAHFASIDEAISWEKHLKRWSGKKKKALADGNWLQLEHNALCKNSTNHLIDLPKKYVRYSIAILLA